MSWFSRTPSTSMRSLIREAACAVPRQIPIAKAASAQAATVLVSLFIDFFIDLAPQLVDGWTRARECEGRAKRNLNQTADFARSFFREALCRSGHSCRPGRICRGSLRSFNHGNPYFAPSRGFARGARGSKKDAHSGNRQKWRGCSRGCPAYDWQRLCCRQRQRTESDIRGGFGR